jgi:hypothetical protein
LRALLEEHVVAGELGGDGRGRRLGDRRVRRFDGTVDRIEHLPRLGDPGGQAQQVVQPGAEPRDLGERAARLVPLDGLAEEPLGILVAAGQLGGPGRPLPECGLLGLVGRDGEGLLEVGERLVVRVKGERPVGRTAQRDPCLDGQRLGLRTGR